MKTSGVFVLFVVSLLACSKPSSDLGASIPNNHLSFIADEGTMMSVDVSPDGARIVFDLLGDIYELPIEGGEARAIRTGTAWDEAPRYSNDGSKVFFISDAGGIKNVWELNLSDNTTAQISNSKYNIVGNLVPSENPNLIFVVSFNWRTNDRIVNLLDVKTGDLTRVNAPAGPTIDLNAMTALRSPENVHGFSEGQSTLFFSKLIWDSEASKRSLRLFEYNLTDGVERKLTASDAARSEYEPELSHDNNLIAYFAQYQDGRTELRLRNISSGYDEKLIELQSEAEVNLSSEDIRPQFAFTPDDEELVFSNQGKIYRLNRRTKSLFSIPFSATVSLEIRKRAKPPRHRIEETVEAQTIRWPTVSIDGARFAYAAFGYVWVQEGLHGAPRRLTKTDDFEYMPAISPDGTKVAFTRFARDGGFIGPGELMIVDWDGNNQRKILSDEDSQFILPAWSQDSSKLALVREFKSDRSWKAMFGWTLVDQPNFNSIADAPSPTARFKSGPISSTRIAFTKSGDELLISYAHRLSERKIEQEIKLEKVSLDGLDHKIIAIADGQVQGVVPSPDLTSAILTRKDSTLWVAPLCDKNCDEPIALSLDAPNTFRISELGGYYAQWIDSNKALFGFGNYIFLKESGSTYASPNRIRVQLPRPKSNGTVAFSGARLITMSGGSDLGEVYENGTIIVQGSRIVKVGRSNSVSIPNDAQIIDVTGKTIIPGLIDTHYHGIGGRGIQRWRGFQLPSSSFGDPTAINYGITSAWDPSGPYDDGSPAMVDLQNVGRIVGPRWSHSAQGTVGFPYDLIEDYADVQNAVRRHKALGAGLLKEYSMPNRIHRQWLQQAALEEGVGLISHIDQFSTMMTLIMDGYTGGDHPHIPAAIYDDIYKLLADSGYIWTPNIVITDGSFGNARDNIPFFREALRTHQREEVGDRAREPEIGTSAPLNSDSFFAPRGQMETNRVYRIALLTASSAKRGVRIGASAHSMPGYLLHAELWYMRKGGMRIEDVLRAATMNNAQKIGWQEEVGSLEEGKVADFLILTDNPLDNILNTMSIENTIQGGVIYDANTAEPVSPDSLAERKH